METELIPETTLTGNKVYPVSQFYGAFFLGGPVGGAYMMAHNFKTLGQPEKVRMVWIVTIIGTIALMGISFLIADHANFPSYLLPVIYSSAGTSMVRFQQGEQIKDYLEAGGAAYNWKKALVISLASLILLLVLIFGGAVFAELIADVNGKTG